MYTRKFNITILTLSTLFLFACTQADVTEPAIVNNPPAEVTATPSATETVVASTDTPTPEPSEVVYTEEELATVLQNYKVFVFSNLSATLLKETAEGVQSEAISSADGFAVALLVGALTKAADEAYDQSAQADIFVPHWEEMQVANKKINDLVLRWFDKEIDSTEVLDEVQSILETYAFILSVVEIQMQEQYGYTSDQLAALRQQTSDEMGEALQNQP
ncbi:MAG: hypothetical protein DWQ07_08315 [Chloroflexi bacterium]|nr:MAG: hypothetical protein DWQ07_08315 [Chloroflexota bacterium]MBL1193285.1 hypothetical protein [Chloroflexota bacterium]NOH10577.1 hypothetical protein [Chloroflexota bacterium]